MKDEVLLTKAGRDRLLQELQELKGPKRMQVGEALREARAHGDIRENAAYDEAKTVQARLEGRIRDLEWILDHAKIVERPDGVGELLHIGSQATLHDLERGGEFTVTLVGAFEADPEHGLISIVSPMGKALIGRGVGETVTVKTPRGEAHYRIVAAVEPA